MDKLRFSLWISLAALLYYGFIMWQIDYPAAKPTPVAESTKPADTLPQLPGSPAPTTVAPPPAITVPTLPSTPVASAAANVEVRTDVLDMTISAQGGDILRADLTAYPLSKEESDRNVRLFDSAAENFFIGRSGLLATDESLAPTHRAQYSSPSSSYELAADQNTLTVPLTWTNAQGVAITKTYTFKRGSYVIDVEYRVDNRSNSDWSAASYVQFERRQPIIETSMFNAETYAFTGPSIYDGKSNRNLKLNDEENQNYSGTFTAGWMAAMQHHFVAAAVPKSDQPYEYHLKIESPQQFTFSYRGPIVTVASGANGEFRETLFVGPKIQSQLERVGSKLEYTADYGKLAIVCQPLFWVLSKVHSFVGNWGWSIILVTLIIKLVFYKLTEASGKSMAKMREMAPRLKALQERYKDNREELGRATMEFYKREKINPLAGCLPTLVQMPVWMAFYWVILNSAEMRQAPFIGYLTDLSTKDPYFILPIILGAANFMQFRLNPAPADPVQAKVMMMMPIVMTGLMAFFPSGLALYWITNTALSIAQQWHINRVVARAAKKA